MIERQSGNKLPQIVRINENLPFTSGAMSGYKVVCVRGSKEPPYSGVVVVGLAVEVVMVVAFVVVVGVVAVGVGIGVAVDVESPGTELMLHALPSTRLRTTFRLLKLTA